MSRSYTIRMTEEKAKELLSRIASFVGLKLVEKPRDAWMDRHFYFSNGNARYTNNYFSAEKMLHLVLLSKDFPLIPGTWELGVPVKDSYRNPFYGMSLEEMQIRLDLEEED